MEEILLNEVAVVDKREFSQRAVVPMFDCYCVRILRRLSFFQGSLKTRQ